MRHIARVVGIVAALAAFPAGADESTPVPGSAQDPFSQTYTGADHGAQPARAEGKPEESRPCDRSCSCSRHGPAPERKAHDREDGHS